MILSFSEFLRSRQRKGRTVVMATKQLKLCAFSVQPYDNLKVNNSFVKFVYHLVRHAILYLQSCFTRNSFFSL